MLNSPFLATPKKFVIFLAHQCVQKLPKHISLLVNFFHDLQSVPFQLIHFLHMLQ